MTAPSIRVDPSPMWLVRLRARAPRFAVTVAAVVLSAAGLASVLASPRGRVVTAERPSGPSAAVLGVAQEFARVYLSWDPDDPGRRETRLAAFGPDLNAITAETLGNEARDVQWTAVVGARRLSSRRELVMVSVDDGSQTTYLAVTVARDRAGRLYVAGPPAIVGPPAIATHELSDPQPEVDDPALRAVCVRVARNYLAGDRGDLAADLAPRIVVTLPSRTLRVASVDAITWAARPRRAAVALVARGGGGLRVSLRYELDVVRVGRRWLVRAVHVNPVEPEVSQ